MIKRLYILLILLSIVGSGIFKDQLLYVFSDFINWLLETTGLLDIGSIHEILSSTTSKQSFQDKNLGLVLYYPFYLSFHFWFIIILFPPSKFRRQLIVFLAILFFLIVLGRLTFGLLGWISLQSYFTRLLKSIFGMPFILLFIEGGRLILKDINDKYS